MRLSLTFTIIAGIMALDKSGGRCQQGAVVEAFNGASRPAMPGMMPSDSLQIATQPLESCPCSAGMAQAHRLTSSFLKLKVAANFCRFL